jgi:O-antigen/teichoic acid export membrane protein
MTCRSRVNIFQAAFHSIRSLSSRSVSLLKSRFAINVATISVGQLVGSGLSILAAPVLGRLYSPELYGMLAAYMAFSTVLGSIGNWQYSTAIIVEKSSRRANTLVQICTYTTLLTTLLVAIPVAAIVTHFSESSNTYWMLPVTTLVSGTSMMLLALSNRRKQFRLIAISQVSSFIVTISVSLILGFYRAGFLGLFIAYFLGQLTSYSALLYGVLKTGGLPIRPRKWKEIIAVSRRHRGYPLYTLPSSFIFGATSNSPVYALTALHAVSVLGAYSRAMQLLALPLNLIAASVTQVFQRRAAEEFADKGNCRDIFKKTGLFLAITGAVPTIAVLVFAPTLFRIYLGEKWEAAGHISRILAPMLYSQVVCSPLASIFFVTGHNKLAFQITLTHAVITWFVIGGLTQLFGSPTLIIGGYAAMYTLNYIVFLVCSWKLASGSIRTAVSV